MKNTKLKTFTITLDEGTTSFDVQVEAKSQAEAKKIAYKNYLMGNYTK